MKTTEKTKMYAEIEKHGANLNAIFNTGLDNITLCKKLRSLELRAHELTTDSCNTGNDNFAKECAILTKVKKILFPDTFKGDVELYKAVFINGDARGYALKISDEYVRKHNLKIYTDWGGNGIIAPDFTPNLN